MLTFKLVNGLRGKILFDQTSRIEFDKLRNQFKTQNDAARFARQFNYSMKEFVYPISCLGSYNIGMTLEFCKKCKELNIPYIIEQKLKQHICPDLCISDFQSVPNSKYKFRDYQYRLLQGLCKYGRGVIVSPTRSGKSLIIAGLCHNILLNSQKNNIHNILIITPNIQLITQFYDDLYDYYTQVISTETKKNKTLQIRSVLPWSIIKFSSEQAKKNNKFEFKDKNIIISNMQWLLLHGDELPYIDCIIQDEVHTCKKGNELSKLIKNVDIPFKFGCTGTLPKKIVDQWNICGIFGPVVDEIKIQQLQTKKVLAQVNINPIKFIHKQKQNFRDISKIKNNNQILQIAKEEYRKESMYLSSYEPTNKIITDIAVGVIKQHPQWNVLILFDYNNSGQSLFNLLKWKDKHYIDGSVELQTRQDIIHDMNNPAGGHITVANFKCASTGLTILNMPCIILVTNQSSITKIIQAIGRGLRRVQKQTLYFFDIFHNYKYSEQHFKQRTELYKEFYNKQLDKDYKIKEISI